MSALQNEKCEQFCMEKWLILIMKEVNSNAMLSYGQPEDKDVDLPNVFLFF